MSCTYIESNEKKRIKKRTHEVEFKAKQINTSRLMNLFVATHAFTYNLKWDSFKIIYALR